MPKPASGELRVTERGHAARITLKGRERETYDLPTCRTRAEAKARMLELSAMARRFRKAGVIDTKDARDLLEMAARATDAMLVGVKEVAEELAGGQLEDVGAKVVPTFQAVGEMWTNGDFHKRYPDKVEDIFHDTNRQRLEKAVYPLLGPKPIDRITRADCDRVMQHLPVPKGRDKLSPTTRRQYAGLMNRILNLAELAGYIERNPLPRGWLPKPGPKKRFPILYPLEDRQLLADVTIPLCFRVLYGFLHREGMRRGEAATLQFYELDLDHETVALDENKTDHPRWWKLAPGVGPALKAWKELRDAKPEDFVFIDENGGPLDVDHMADRLRVHLKAAGLKRPDLYSVGPLKGQFGTHCFRRSFVTRSLGIGRTDDWVRQRTGHTSEELLTYRQAARAITELELGDVDPLDLAIPELSGIAPGLPAQWSGRPDSNRRPLDPQAETAPPKSTAEAEKKPIRDREEGRAETTSGQSEPLLGQSDDVVEAALADALTRASAAGQWDVVARLAGELEARRKARRAPEIVDLDAARRRRHR